MNSPAFRSTKALFITLLILTICSYIPWEVPSNELHIPDQSLMVAVWLAGKVLPGIAVAVILMVLVYRTWSNVSQLPTGGGEPVWIPTPLAAALPLLVPLFGYAWHFVAYGRLSQLVAARSGQILMPRWLLAAFLSVAALLGLQLTWAELINAELLPRPSLPESLKILLSGITPAYNILQLLVAFYLTRFNASKSATVQTKTSH
ncbi:MAG: hypothetical protein Q4F30_01480 [Akkermansia sp.]|nr:hypothetical protein [Akkermansia sp.]